MSQCPFTDGLASVLAVNPLSSLQLTVLSLLDIIDSRLGAKTLLLNTSFRQTFLRGINDSSRCSAWLPGSGAGKN